MHGPKKFSNFNFGSSPIQIKYMDWFIFQPALLYVISLSRIMKGVFYYFKGVILMTTFQ